MPNAWRQRRRYLEGEGQIRGMEISELEWLKGLADENARLEPLLVDAMHHNAALKFCLGKKC